MDNTLNITNKLDEKTILNVNKNFEVRKHQKKKNNSNSLQSLEYNINDSTDKRITEKINENTNEIGNSHSPNKCSVKKKIHKRHFSTDLSSEDICNINGESFLPKKRKNHNTSIQTIEFSTISSTEQTTEEKKKEKSIKNIPNYCSNKKSKSIINSTPVSEVISFEDNCNTSNECLEKKFSKKKKHNNSLISIKSTKDNKTEEKTNEKSDEKVNSHDLNMSVLKKKKKKNYISTDIVLENNCIIDNEGFEKKSSKKSKKHDKNLRALEFTTENSIKENVEETNGESTDNVKGFNLEESVIKKNRNLIHISSPVSTDISLEDSCNTSNECLEKKFSKKKKHNNRLISIKSTMDNKTEEKTNEKSVEKVNSRDLNVSVLKKKKKKKYISTDIVLENNCIIDNEGFEKKSSKNSKKHDKKIRVLEFTTENSIKENVEETNGESTDNVKGFNLEESVIKKNRNLIHISSPVSTDISLEDSCNTSNECLGINSPKKKKKCNKISVESTTIDNRAEEMIMENTNEEFIENISNYKLNMPATISKKHENQFLTDIKLKYFSDVNDESCITVSPKNRKKHVKSLYETETTTNNNLEESCMYDKHKLKERENLKSRILKYSSPQKNDITSIVDSIKSLENNLSEYDDNNETNNINSNNTETILNENGPHTFNCDDENTFFNCDELDTLLDVIDSHELENSVEVKKTRLKNFDLVDFLISSNSSFKHHPCFSSILNKLTKQIKNLVNEKLELASQSDIELLKIIGGKILEKIIEKENCSESVKNLKIKLPHNHKIKYQTHYLETTLCRQPDKNTMDLIKSLNPLVKLGAFNDDEDNIIRKYWSKFQQKYNILDVRPFLSSGLQMLLPHKEKLKFFRFLALELPNRLLCSVHNRFNSLFGERANKISFKKEEDKIIMKVDNCDAIKNKYSVLSFILNRTRVQLYRRLNSLKLIPFRGNRIHWDDQKRQELFTYIMLETNTDDWKSLKNLKIKKKTWIRIANCFSEPISYEKLQRQWYFLSTMLFCETPIRYSTFKLKLLEHLLQINPKHWSDLKWNDISNDLYPGSSGKVIFILFFWWVYPCVPKEIRRNARDTLKYLSRNSVDAVLTKIKKDKDYEFPRLTVEHYDLLVNND